jgi:hypothetical protein
MNSNARRTVALAIISGSCLSSIMNGMAASTPEAKEAVVMMSSYEQEQSAAAAARDKDPAWKPACTEIGLIKVGDGKQTGALRNFCLNADGNILACYAPRTDSGKSSTAESAPGLRVISPKGELLKTLPLEIKPTAVCVAKDGSIFVAGDGQVLKLDAAGKVLASATSPVAKEPVAISKEIQSMAEEMAKENKGSAKEELARMKESLEKRRADVTGLTVTGEDVFMAVPAPNDFSYRVYRLDLALQKPQLVVEKLRGCCGQMDIQSHDGNLWIPHNARHAVEARDRDGKELSKFGKAGRVKAADFGGCCEPKNLRVLANGDILAAESGPPTCIKRYSATGKFLGVIASVPNAKGDCVRVTVEVSPDGTRYYMLDTTRDVIRIFGAKS